MNAAAPAHRVELMCRKPSRWMMGEAPHHAVLVVDRYKGVAVERVVAVGRDHGVERHDPLRDPPVKLVCPGRTTHADHHAAAGLDHFEASVGIASEFCTLADMQGIAAQVMAVQKGHVHGINAAL